MISIFFWHLITSNSSEVLCLDYDDICKLCVHRRAFPELLFYEDSNPSLYEKLDMNRRRRLRQDQFSSVIDPKAPLRLPIMALVPKNKEDIVFDDDEEEYADDDDDEYDNDEEKSILLNYVRLEQNKHVRRESEKLNNNEWCKCILQ